MYFYSSALTAISIAFSLLVKSAPDPYNASYFIELAITFLTFRLALGCFVPFTLGLFYKLRYDSLLACAAIMWAAALLIFVKAQPFVQVSNIFSHIDYEFAICAACVLGLAYVLAHQEAKPIIETDSLHSFPFINDWINSKRSTIDANYGYSSIWESYLAAGFLLQKAENRSQGHLFAAQIQPIALMSLVMLSMICKFTSSYFLIVVALLHFLSLYILWCWPSGIRSLKNDNCYNAGMSLFLHALLSIPTSDGFSESYLELSVGAILGSVKYSGFLVLPLTAISALVLNVLNFGTEFLGKSLLVISTAGMTSLLPALIFPLRNFKKYANALYPVRVKFRGQRLPGKYDPDQTSVLHAIQMPALWKNFTSRHYMERHLAWPMGVLLLIQVPLAPFIFLTAFLFSFYEENFYYSYIVEFCTISIVIIVFAWVITVWSASKSKNDLYYMWRLMQTRYVTVVPLLATVALVGVPRVIAGDQFEDIESAVIAILLVDTALRLYATISVPPRRAALLYLAAVSCFLLGFTVLKLLPSPTSPIEIIAVLTVLSAISVSLFDRLFDSSYRSKLDRYKVKYLQEAIDQMASARVFVPTEIWRHGSWRDNGRADYMAIGQKLQHNVTSGALNDLSREDKTLANIDAVLFFYWDDPLNKIDETFLTNLGRSLARFIHQGLAGDVF